MRSHDTSTGDEVFCNYAFRLHLESSGLILCDFYLILLFGCAVMDGHLSRTDVIFSHVKILLVAHCRLSFDKQKPSLDEAYGFYDDAERGLTNEQRRSALEHVVLPMLQVAHDSAVVEFYTDHISRIMTDIETSHRTAAVISVCCH